MTRLPRGELERAGDEDDHAVSKAVGERLLDRQPGTNKKPLPLSGKYLHRNLTRGIGPNLPQEAPQAFADAVMKADRL